jgi:nucleoid-associated protein EbfC
MFGKLGDMMGKLQEMKRMAEEMKVRLEAMSFSAQSDDGRVKVEISGMRKVKKLELTGTEGMPAAELSQKVLDTMNRAMSEAEKVNESEMKKVAGGLIPGLGF